MQRRHFIGLLRALVPGIAAGKAQPVNETKALTIQESPIAGIHYHQGEAIWDQLAVGHPLTLAREPDNRCDSRAVRVDWQGHKLGYLPRAENVAVAQMMDRGYRRTESIVRLQRDSSPWQRVRIDVQTSD